jgi:hypothetical protein
MIDPLTDKRYLQKISSKTGRVFDLVASDEVNQLVETAVYTCDVTRCH